MKKASRKKELERRGKELEALLIAQSAERITEKVCEAVVLGHILLGWDTIGGFKVIRDVCDASIKRLEAKG